MPEDNNSRPVISNQTGLHDQLETVVRRHCTSPFQKPLADFNVAAFVEADQRLQQHGGPLILDSCCGVGASTRLLARRFPQHLVIGVDRSEHRLQRQWGELPDNALLVRADLVDFWRLARQAGWRPDYHFLLYPNPYPKKKDLKLRWHGHPVFPDLLALGGVLECRSNWKLYVGEMQQALKFLGVAADLNPVEMGDEPLTPFELKYARSGHQLWQLKAQLQH
ncbi:tRNA (guanine(46)-N(7))-methyltransferase TrmB [Marinospirillum alkaliphilum]|uniref:tRNA (guanine(46)-N(7))-methyltransferase n=1 Tax=Marinospirillum alkaliphilum DSM 21637 TaxID=1122209 RepID=A0A1K1Z7T5_9GAMM|nr:SAM-dependent methyltransferase [Marinospirillum alkaliphilum]SFX70128.1 tRNA G46 methylase TrmB [Marinospirillum alkaliphilum DSM 21637]